MFFVIPEMPSKTFVIVLKKLPDPFKHGRTDLVEVLLLHPEHEPVLGDAGRVHDNIRRSLVLL